MIAFILRFVNKPIRFYKKQKILLQINPLKRYKLRRRIISSLIIIFVISILFLTGYITGNCTYKSEKLEIRGMQKIERKVVGVKK